MVSKINRHQIARKCSRQEPPHNFVDDMVHVSPSDTRDEFKLQKMNLRQSFLHLSVTMRTLIKKMFMQTNQTMIYSTLILITEDTDEDRGLASQYLDYVKPSRVSRAQEALKPRNDHR